LLLLVRPLIPWHVADVEEGALHPRLLPTLPCPPALSPPSHPPDGQVTAAALADVTGDGRPEWLLVVWRPWRDWPIQRWRDTPSPIAAFHDDAGHSCHLILLDAESGREVWAGSALPAPLAALGVGDVDGDRRNELVTLEGEYTAGRSRATQVDLWHWNGFGFTLDWRSPPGLFHRLCLTDVDGDDILEIVVR
jgi:hypothetical protein